MMWHGAAPHAAHAVHAALDTHLRALEQALCVAPNRELAKQISVEVMKMGMYLISPSSKIEIGEKEMAGMCDLTPAINIKMVLKDERFESAIEEQIVVGTPGSGFGAAGEGYFRLSAFNSRENVNEAMRRIKEALTPAAAAA